MTPVLYYHRVGHFHPNVPRKMNVSPENFRKQMEHLRRRKYAFVGLDRLDSHPKAAAVSFDDGYRDLLEHAVPVLRELAIPATFFIVAGAMGRSDSWYRAEDKIMDWPDLSELVRSGFSIGSHSMSHPRLDLIPLETARREIFDSKKLLEDRLGVRVEHFAYPQGKHTPAVMDLVREAGYREAWGTRSASGQPFSRRRFRVPGSAGLFRFAAKIMKIRLGYY